MRVFAVVGSVALWAAIGYRINKTTSGDAQVSLAQIVRGAFDELGRLTSSLYQSRPRTFTDLTTPFKGISEYVQKGGQNLLGSLSSVAPGRTTGLYIAGALLCVGAVVAYIRSGKSAPAGVPLPSKTPKGVGAPDSSQVGTFSRTPENTSTSGVLLDPSTLSDSQLQEFVRGIWEKAKTKQNTAITDRDVNELVADARDRFRGNVSTAFPLLSPVTPFPRNSRMISQREYQDLLNDRKELEELRAQSLLQKELSHTEDGDGQIQMPISEDNQPPIVQLQKTNSGLLLAYRLLKGENDRLKGIFRELDTHFGGDNEVSRAWQSVSVANKSFLQPLASGNEEQPKYVDAVVDMAGEHISQLEQPYVLLEERNQKLAEENKKLEQDLAELDAFFIANQDKALAWKATEVGNQSSFDVGAFFEAVKAREAGRKKDQ